jgi:hypothetical protein
MVVVGRAITSGTAGDVRIFIAARRTRRTPGWSLIDLPVAIASIGDCADSKKESGEA